MSLNGDYFRPGIEDLLSLTSTPYDLKTIGISEHLPKPGNPVIVPIYPGPGLTLKVHEMHSAMSAFAETLLDRFNPEAFNAKYGFSLNPEYTMSPTIVESELDGEVFLPRITVGFETDNSFHDGYPKRRDGIMGGKVMRINYVRALNARNTKEQQHDPLGKARYIF